MRRRPARIPAVFLSVNSFPASLPLALAVLAVLALPACSGGRDASLSVRLVYGQDEASGVSGALPQGGFVVAEGIATAPPLAAYSQEPDNRILIRVLAPHIDPPMEAWFDRSAGKGTIAGIPPGERIAVEVDEYDNTARTLMTNAPLLGRGWTHGITLAPGEHKDVPITMHDKGTIVQACGNPPSGGAGNAGDTGDGGLAVNAALGQPVAIKAGPDDSLYVSSAQYSRVRKIDRYGYIWHFAGNGQTGTLTDGQAASDAPIGVVMDIEFNLTGDIYFITLDQQILSIIKLNNNIHIIYDMQKGIFNPFVKPDFAILNDNNIFYTNGIDDRVYILKNGERFEYVVDNMPYQTQEGADKLHYPVRYPASITYSMQTEAIVFCDRDNNKIKRVPISVEKVFTEVGNSIYIEYYEGMDPWQMTPLKPTMVEYINRIGMLFFSERDYHNVKFIDYYGKVRTFAGSDISGFSGDGGPATAARLNDPGAVTVDSRGNVYIADTGNHAIRMVVGGALP
jgi:hypothetical protein